MDAAVEVYRSSRAADCAERVFVLDALGIQSETQADDASYVVMVENADAPRALRELAQYELERQPAPAAQWLPAPTHPHAWLGCVVYAGVLIWVALAVANGLWQPDAFRLGALDAGRVQAGQWWRAWTALTLHLNGAHLLANLTAGVWFGYLAGRQLGSGHAWFLALLGAAGANLIEALLGPASHRAVGASTAVFTALGILAAYSWRTRARGSERWATQWAPLVGGVVLLGWLGSGGGQGGGGGSSGAPVDIVGHVLGFATGLALGALAAYPYARRLLDRTPQWLTGMITLAELAVAWRWALAG